MNLFTFLVSSMLILGGSPAEDLEPVSNAHVLIHGFTVEKVFGSENEANAPDTRCIVYKDNEIYVAFKSNEKGEYVFNLPIGQKYELVFGGPDFVNKKVVLDARGCMPKKKEGHIVEMDMSLFRPVDGIDYSDMENPVVRWYFNQNERNIVPDFDVVDAMWRTVEKLYKKSEKTALK